MAVAVRSLRSLTPEQSAAPLALPDETDKPTSNADMLAAMDLAGLNHLTVCPELFALAACADETTLPRT